VAKKKGKTSRKADDLPPIPDRRALEGAMWGALPGLFGGAPGGGDLEDAQQIMYQAFEAGGPKQVALAKKALQVCPDCADAYVVLAEHAETLEEALRLNAEGVAAGQRALGPRAFKEYEGQFWGFLETRPYMRARLALAQCLWAAGRREEAIEHYREMLRLNPGDNQGVRYILVSCLLDLDRREELRQLLDKYEDDATANWGYANALLAFRAEGESPRARQLLLEAKKTNKHVPAYLLGSKSIPEALPEYVGFGDENEAASYAAENLRVWKESPGAITWLRKTLKVPLARPRKRSLPWGRLKLRIARLETAADEVWQVDARQVAVPEGSAQAEAAPWLTLVTSPTEGAVIGVEVQPSEPTSETVWQHLVEAMLHPQFGSPRRPGEIQFCRADLAEAMSGKLEQVRIESRLCEELDRVDHLVQEALPAFGLDKMLSGELPAHPADAADPNDLPQQVGEVWQADVRRMAAWIAGEGDPYRPWGLLVVGGDRDLILGNDLTQEKPPPDAFARQVLRAMTAPLAGEPHRPGVVEVRSEEYRQCLEPVLESAGVRCVVVERLDLLDEIFQGLGRHLAGPEALTPLMEVPGVEPRHAAGFFAAAAEFYRRAPWRRIPGDTPIEIRSSKSQSGPWYAVVMGQSGMTLGLAMYEDRKTLKELLSGKLSDRQGSRRTSGLSVMYGEAFDMPAADVNAAEELSWEIAGPEAYPWAIRVNRGGSIRPPLAWELELLEGCLRAIPEFLARKQPSGSVTVPVSAGQLTLELAVADPGDW
jgi:tetratricopeptide (TPR) repeat protein